MAKIRKEIVKLIGKDSTDDISRKRSVNMAKIASGSKGKKFRAIWKIGNDHVDDIKSDPKIPQSAYALTSRKEFNDDHPSLPVLRDV